MSGLTHADRSKNRNSSAASCGLSGPWMHSKGKLVLVPVHVPGGVPPTHCDVEPGQSELWKHPLHVPPMHCSVPWHCAFELQAFA